MATINYTSGEGNATICPLRENDTVLQALERQGIAVANSCRSGVCQSCLMQASAGTVPPAAQNGLKDSLRARGYFLACVCRPTEDLTVHPAQHAVQRARAVVRRIEKLSHDVARVLLSYDGPFEYWPGQFVNLVRSDGLTRSYSLANLRDDAGANGELLELHVRKIVDGKMSQWLHEEAQAGDSFHVQGPQGDCFYVPGMPEQPILLAGTGTGLAPLFAIARDALRQGHTGPIRLYHGARDPQGLYLVKELQRLAAGHANFIYSQCVLAGEGPGVRVGAMDQTILSDIPKLSGWRVYLCGDPNLVTTLRKKAFMAGAKMKDIYSDAFVMRALA